MKKTFLLSTLIFTLSHVFGQSDSLTIYKNLKTEKFYSVNLSAVRKGRKLVHRVNGKKVSKSTYDKFDSAWENMANCCPCILEAYDEKDNLLKESVACTDCGVGWFKEYYLNGKLKLSGSFKENPTGNWDNIWDRGYCSIPEGEWIYFNKNGDTLYSEFWNSGNFVKQVPEQKTAEIWKVDLTLDGKNIDTQKVAIEQVGDLLIQPKYKNSNSNSNLSITFEVSAIGHQINQKRFTLESFKKISVASMLAEVKIPKDEKTMFLLSVLNNGIVIEYFSLNVVQ